MKANPVLRFEFAPAEDAADRNNGWGQGMLFLNGQPYWFSNTEKEPQPVAWTWVDLLEHLAEVWGTLVAEQTYPFSWLAEAAHPGEMWKSADRRWARLGEEAASQEEPRLIDFDRRHNLSAAWKGIGLPALVWLRVGETVWLSPEVGAPVRASFDECREALVQLGDEMARAYSRSSNSRVAAAVNAWSERGTAFRRDFLELATGLSRGQLQAIQGGKDATSFWELAANSNWESGKVQEGELLAAARMTAGVLDVTSIGRVLREIRKIKSSNCEELDDLAAKTTGHLATKRVAFAFEAGYVAAEFFKNTRSETRKKFVDVGELLHKLNVGLVEIDIGTDEIDAVALWGARGPCILLNSARAHSDHDKRTRMTLAHELGHLLIDRKGGLPFCEVLGGQVDDFVERRANAFAAELLLPRASVVYEWTQWRGNFRGFLLLLGHEYGVSNTVACAQIHNSSVFAKLDPTARRYVTSRLHDFEGQSNPGMVRGGSGVI